MSLEEKQSAALEALSSGNISEAIKLLHECVGVAEQSHGADSLLTAQCYFTLALIIFRTDRSDVGLKDAVNFGTKALKVRRVVKGDIDASVALTAEFLGSLYRLLDSLSEAENMYRLCLEIAENLVGPHHINTGKAQLELGHTLLLQDKNLEEATDLVEKSVQTKRRVFGANSDETVSALFVLARVFEARGETQKATEIMHEAKNLNLLTENTSIAPSQQSMR
jgi:tetratricopeptide (TPR) repeat protein